MLGTPRGRVDNAGDARVGGARTADALPVRRLGVFLHVLDRALGREVAQTFAGALVVLVLALASARGVRLLGAAAAGELPAPALVALLGFELLSALAVLVPAALFVAALSTCGRWYRDHEMVVLAMAGVGPLRVGRALLGVGVPVTVLAGALALYGAPWAQARSADLQQAIADGLRSRLFQPGEFRVINDGAQVFYAAAAGADGALVDVYVQLETDAGPARALAASAVQRLERASGDIFLVLRDGVRYEGAPGDAAFRTTTFSEYGVRLERPAGDQRPGRREAQPTRALVGSDSPPDVAELQWRLSMPLAALTLALAALPLARGAPRTGAGGRVVLGALAFLVYYNLLSTAQALTATGQLPAWLGVWAVHVPAWAGLALFYFAPQRLRARAAA